MRKFSFFFSGLVIAIFSVFLTSCEDDEIRYGFDSVSEVGFFKLYSTYDDFLVGKDTMNFKTLFVGNHFGSGEDHIPSGFPVSFMDVRQESGESNWSDPRLTALSPDVYTESGNQGSWMPYKRYYDERVLYRAEFNSPPAHLHLCLRSWNENPKGTRPGRTWKVKSIVDDNGNDLSRDPDWENYTDNTMRFNKTDRFVFTVGEKRSKKEEELFGIFPKNDTVYGTYNFGARYDVDYMKLSLVFPNFTRVLEVTESTFGMVKLRGTEGGKTGVLVLEPID